MTSQHKHHSRVSMLVWQMAYRANCIKHSTHWMMIIKAVSGSGMCCRIHLVSMLNCAFLLSHKFTGRQCAVLAVLASMARSPLRSGLHRFPLCLVRSHALGAIVATCAAQTAGTRACFQGCKAISVLESQWMSNTTFLDWRRKVIWSYQLMLFSIWQSWMILKGS